VETELPFLVRLEESEGPILVEGFIDRLVLIREGDALVGAEVLDFKTDADLQTALPVYRRQVAYYCEAIARASGAAATGVLLWL